MRPIPIRGRGGDTEGVHSAGGRVRRVGGRAVPRRAAAAGVPELYMLAWPPSLCPWGRWPWSPGATPGSAPAGRPPSTDLGQQRINVTVRLDNPTPYKDGRAPARGPAPLPARPRGPVRGPGSRAATGSCSYELRAARAATRSARWPSRPGRPVRARPGHLGAGRGLGRDRPPRVEAADRPGLGGELASSAATKVRYLFSQGDEFYTTREYRDGDDLRKVRLTPRPSGPADPPGGAPLAGQGGDRHRPAPGRPTAARARPRSSRRCRRRPRSPCAAAPATSWP